MRKRRSAYLEALERRREAARQQPEETSEAGEATGVSASGSPLTRFLLPKRRRPYWK